MKPLVLLVIALVAAWAVACGDEGERTSDSPPKSDAGQAAPTESARGTTGGKGPERDAPGKAEARKPPAKPGPYEPAEAGDRYVPSASDGKVHGDGSIERFGAATSDDEAKAAVAAAVGFYDARAQGDWARACGLMATGIQKQLTETFGRAPEAKDRGCPEILAALAGSLPRQLRVKQARTLRFIGLRAEGERGFALFVSDTIPHGFVPMSKEDGRWRVAALSGSAL